jgi:dephospho-CoA kinase
VGPVTRCGQSLAWHRLLLGQRVVLDAPLLLESPLLRMLCHPIVVVWCDEDTEVRRVMARDACDEPAARAKVAAQWPLARKKQLADLLVDNNGTRDQLRERVLQLWDSELEA